MVSDHNRIQQEISNRKIVGESWKLNNTPLSNSWVKVEISKEIKMDPELSENENRIHPNLAVDMANAVLRGRVIALKAYSRRGEKLISTIQEPRKWRAK